MSKVVIAGDASGTGTFTISAPNGNTDRTLVLPDEAGTLVTTSSLPNPLTSGTAVASTSGTAIDFTGLPSWVKRITVMFNGVSTNGTSLYLIQLGSGSVDTAGYVSTCIQTEGSALYTPQSSTSGFIISHSGTSDILSGQMVLTLVDGNVWASSHQGKTDTTSLNLGGGNKSALSGALDRVRITTVNGTDTFDAGSINIMYE